MTAAMNVLMLVVPIYSLQVYDRVLTSRSGSTLAYLTLFALVLIAGYSFMEWVRLKVLLRLGNRFELAHAQQLMDACVAQSARFSNPSSALLRDLAVVRTFIASPQGVVALIDVPVAVLFIVVVFLISPVLGFAMLFGVIVLLILAVLTDRATHEPVRLAGEAAQRAHERSAEIVERCELVEALGMRRDLVNRWLDAMHENLHQQSRSADAVADNTATGRWARLVLSISMTALGAGLAIEGKITMGAMIASSILMGRGLAPLENVIALWRQIATVRQAWQRLAGALELAARPELETRLPKPEGRVSIEQVTYGPPGAEEPTIKNLSLEIPAGGMLGVVGPVAAGKSTLAKLMCGIWRPQSGNIRLDGADIFLWPRDDIGSHVGYLPQGAELLRGTVRDNIARFTACADEAVVEAARLAGVHDIILRLPKAYDTPIGPGGLVLSGGTRQRIGLARALFGSPCLVVLDEPSASLDGEGEQALLAALRQMRERRTTIVVITHQKAILQDAEYVAVLVDGRLHNYGPRRQLMPLPGDAPGSAPAVEERV